MTDAKRKHQHGVGVRRDGDAATARPASLSRQELADIIADPVTLELRDDLDAVVPAIPPQTFSAIVHLLRDEGRLDLLLPYATPEQLTAVLDLEAWDRDRVHVLVARSWLTEIADAYEAARFIERGDLVRTMYAMDPEMWTLALHTGTAVLELDPEDDETRDRARRMVDDLRTYDTPDGLFLVAAPDNAAGRQALRVIERVYDDNLTDGRALVNGIRHALPSGLEEQLYHWRAGRLSDLGFVPWEDAMRLFRPLSLSAAQARASGEELAPGLRADAEADGLHRIDRTGLLQRALARLDEREHGLRLREFTLLVNTVMSAQRMTLRDRAQQERAVRQTQATLSLGLEQLAAAHDAEPWADAGAELDDYLAERVTVLGLRDIFRLGYGPLVTLRKAANALHRAGKVSLDAVGSLLDRPWGPTIAALASWFPELPLEARSDRLRPLSSLRDVARATARIAEADALARLTFDERGFAVDPRWLDRLDEPGRIKLGDLVRTALVLEALDADAPGLRPLDAAQLAAARDRLVQGSRLIPALRERFDARAEQLGLRSPDSPIDCDELAENLLTRLEVELVNLELDAAGAPDLTRVGGLLTVQHVGVWLRTGLTAT